MIGIAVAFGGLPPLYLLSYEAVNLLRLLYYSGLKRQYLIFRDHNDPVPGPGRQLEGRRFIVTV